MSCNQVQETEAKIEEAGSCYTKVMLEKDDA